MRFGCSIKQPSSSIFTEAKTLPSGSARPSASRHAEQIKTLWLEVCQARGTPLPEPANATLEQALGLCLKGREQHRELAAVSWAAACTRPSYVEQVRSHCIACSDPALFAAELGLMEAGWDLFARMAQLPSNPEDIKPLRAALRAQKETNSQKMEIHLAHVEAALGGAKPQTLPKDPAAWQDH